MLRLVHLHGALGARFGLGVVRLDVATPAEALRALDVQLPGFRAFVRQHDWHVVAGPDLDNGQDRGAAELLRLELGEQDLHLVPVLAGSSNKGGAFSVIAGIGMVLAGVFAGPELMIGLIVAGSVSIVGGAISLATPQPKLGSYAELEDPATRESTFFRTATNTIEQGAALPLVYGKFLTGGVVMSAGQDVEQL